MFIKSLKSRTKERTSYEFQKKAIVNIIANSSNFTGIGTTGGAYATGFVVDAKLGLIVTNKHVTPEYCENILISFSEGQSTSAYHVYSDPTHDFVILSYDTNLIEQEVNELELGNFFTCKVGDVISTMGNNESEKYTFKKGQIISLERSHHRSHAMMMQTSLDISGGSSGSPVFDDNGLVIGIHCSGKQTSSFELCINYIKDKVEQYKTGQFRRGTIGLKLKCLSKWDISDYLDCDVAIFNELYDQVPVSFLVVDSLVPNSVSQGRFIPGDILLEINNRPFFCNSYLFDKIIDSYSSLKVTVKFIRNGRIHNTSIIVENHLLEDHSESLSWAGGSFTELSREIRYTYNISSEKGVFLCRGLDGSPLDNLGTNSEYQADRKGVVIYSICGMEINSLNDLKSVVIKLQGKTKISLHYQDFLYNTPSTFFLMNITDDCWKCYSKYFDKSSRQWVCLEINNEERIDKKKCA